MNIAQAVRHGMVNESHFTARSDSGKSERDEGLFVSDDEEQGSVTAPAGLISHSSQPSFGTDAFALKQGQNDEEQAGNMFMGSSQGKSQLSGAAHMFNPQASIGSTAVCLHMLLLCCRTSSACDLCSWSKAVRLTYLQCAFTGSKWGILLRTHSAHTFFYKLRYRNQRICSVTD